MKLTSLAIENFKQFERTSLTFAPGFTVVKGPNEAGKSSIQAAIVAALFLDPTAPAQALDEYVRWGQNDRFGLRLEFEDAGAHYALAKDFQDGSLTLQWTRPGGAHGATGDVTAAMSIIGDLLGSRSMETYINTACIRGEEVSKAPATAAPVSQRLQAKVIGGRQASAREVIHAIEQELGAMATGGPRRLHETGALRMARERLDVLQRARSATAARLAAHQENVRQLKRLREDLATCEQAIARSAEQLEWSDRAQTVEEDCALLADHLQELQRAKVLHDSVGQVAEELSHLDYETLAAVLERAQVLERRLHHQKLREAEINRQLALLMLTQLQNAPAVSTTTILLGGIMLAIACLAVAVLGHNLPIALGIVPGLALAGYGLKARRTVDPDGSRPHTDELKICTDTIKAAQQELMHLLTSYKLHDVEELATIVRELRPLGELRAARQQRIEQILGDQRAESRQAAMDQVAHEIEVRQADLRVLASRRLSADAYERIDTELLQIRARREQVLREMYRLEGELRANDVNSEMLAGMDEELGTVQVHMARLERRRKALERAHSGMNEALAATLAQASSIFRSGVTKHLASITGGRYDQVEARIDEEGLHLLVYTVDKHRAVNADSLSRATQDQIYLAARMALLELICDGAQPPLLLDDPFVNYDDRRLENTIELLRRLYGTHQIILFTCTDRYDRYADSVIALKGPYSTPDVETVVQVAAS